MARSDSFARKWASAPAQFERPSNTLIDRGWAGGAGEDPPEAKWENWWHNRVDEALAEIESGGAMQWFPDVSYKVGATCSHDDQHWIAAKLSVGIEPGSAADEEHWQPLSLLEATQEQAEAGEDGTRKMTPRRVFQALRSALAKSAIVDAVRPVGSHYIQFSETDGTFASAKAPSTLFGGTWSLKFNTESMFFRTEGALAAAGRSSGVQGDAIRNITASWEGPITGAPPRSTSGAASITDTSSANPGTSASDWRRTTLGFDSSAVVPTAAENRVTNRLIRVWERTA